MQILSIILSLTGLHGDCRLNPHNVHQWPTLVALCGSHRQGAVAINCARQLASHGVRTVVFLLDPTHLPSQLTRELALFKHTNNKIVTTVQGLYNNGIKQKVETAYVMEQVIRGEYVYEMSVSEFHNFYTIVLFTIIGKVHTTIFV